MNNADVWFLGGMILLVWLGAVVWVVRDTWTRGV